MTPVEELRTAKRSMEQQILREVDRAVFDFEKKTNMTPSKITIYLSGVSLINVPGTRWVVSSVDTTVKL